MSATWVALLRGINVGRNQRVAMADLRALLERHGFDEVRTHLQSGNAVFTGAKGGARELEAKIAAAIADDLDLDVKVVVRRAGELAAVVDANPFVAEGVDPKELHVVFLSSAPSKAKLAGVDRDEVAPDRFAPGDRVLYLHLPDGVMASRLPNWERLLGLTVTVRNWRTTTRLREIAGG